MRTTRVKITVGLLALVVAGLWGAGAEAQAAGGGVVRIGPGVGQWWRGVHASVSSDEAADAVIAELPKLAKRGINTIIFEINYAFEYQSHPEVREPRFLSRAAAMRLGDSCRANRIRPVPMINYLGHQSWSKRTFGLLRSHPEFDETPGQYPDNEGIYCRSWCPRHPGVNAVVFDLTDELIDAFKADAFHVGMDEVFLIGSEYCDRCRGADTAELFADAVNAYHKHLVGEKKVEMMMRGDRFLDGAATGYGRWEASKNGTSGAIDRVPKDIVICDWHYEVRKDGYPSLSIFLDKGFRVWPAGWKNVDAVQLFSKDAMGHGSDARMLGYLVTTWGAVKVNDLAEWEPLTAPMKMWRDPRP